MKRERDFNKQDKIKFITCPECDGAGVDGANNTCPDCEGKGKIQISNYEK